MGLVRFLSGEKGRLSEIGTDLLGQRPESVAAAVERE